MIAIPKVPTISTYTPNCATRPITWAPVMLRMVWISRSSTVIHRIVKWSAGVEVPPEPVVRQRGEVADHAGVDRGDGDQQREPVEPADEPAVAGADGELRVLVERTRDRVVAGQLAEDQGDEQHPDDRDEVQPDVRRPAGAEAQDEQRVDADHRREVGERDREVGEQSEDPVQLRLVAQAREPGVVLVGRGRVRSGRVGWGRFGSMAHGTLRSARAAATRTRHISPGPPPSEPRPPRARGGSNPRPVESSCGRAFWRRNQSSGTRRPGVSPPGPVPPTPRPRRAVGAARRSAGARGVAAA